MQRFTELYFELDSTTRTSEKLRALRSYFSSVPPRDAAWALAALMGGKLIRSISSTRLRDWMSEETSYSHWLLSECYEAVGDLAEMLALLPPERAASSEMPLHQLVEDRVLPLPRMTEPEQQRIVVRTWRELDTRQRFLYNKFILGALRVGVAGRLVVRALAEVAGVEPAVIAHRLAGHWQPTPENFGRLISGDAGEGAAARPFPFALAYPLDVQTETLGPVEDWQAEWKWDGIRAQLIHRSGQALVWSRGDELINEGFPEIRALAERLPQGTVLDGEILAWEDDRPLPFAMLQRRINRKREAPRLWDEVPLVYMAFDLLESGGQDCRTLPLTKRRAQLEQLVAALGPQPHLRISPLVPTGSWEKLRERQASSRERGAEGLMLKRRSSGYGVGRQRGQWWKWKVDPYTIDAVLIYAQHGNGKRASIFTDYTFGVWDAGELVPVAKAYSGLTDEEIRKVDAFVRRNTLDRFGPVRLVKPELVFEIAFQGAQVSTRHKSGLAVRFPRIARWRHDKPPREADTIETLRALLRQGEAGILPAPGEPPSERVGEKRTGPVRQEPHAPPELGPRRPSAGTRS